MRALFDFEVYVHVTPSHVVLGSVYLHRVPPPATPHPLPSVKECQGWSWSDDVE